MAVVVFQCNNRDQDVTIAVRLAGNAVVDGTFELIDIDDPNNPVDVQPTGQQGAVAQWVIPSQELDDPDFVHHLELLIRNTSPSGSVERLVRAEQGGNLLGASLQQNANGEVTLGSIPNAHNAVDGIGLLLP